MLRDISQVQIWISAGLLQRLFWEQVLMSFLPSLVAIAADDLEPSSFEIDYNFNLCGRFVDPIDRKFLVSNSIEQMLWLSFHSPFLQILRLSTCFLYVEDVVMFSNTLECKKKTTPKRCNRPCPPALFCKFPSGLYLSLRL